MTPDIRTSPAPSPATLPTAARAEPGEAMYVSPELLNAPVTTISPQEGGLGSLDPLSTEIDLLTISSAQEALTAREPETPGAPPISRETRERFDELLTSGIELLNQRNFAAAVERFYEASRLIPHDLRPHYYTAICRIQEGDRVRAIAALNLAIDISQDEPVLYEMRAGLRLRGDNASGAADDFTKLLAFRPADVDALIGRATARLNQRRNREAIDDATAAVAIAPANPEPYLICALAYFNSGDRSAAHRWYKQALAKGLDPESLPPWRQYLETDPAAEANESP